MGRFSRPVRDTYIAPGVSSFNAAKIPDMSDYHKESNHWVANHFLNSVFRARLEAPLNAYVYNYLRRAEGAFSEHDLARAATADFLASGGQSPSRYAASLMHWEFFLGQCWQAYALLDKLTRVASETEKPSIFDQGDGSVEERLNTLYNSMKHVEKRIAAGQILEGATTPVWLTKEGLQSTDILLKYEETGDILRDVARWADLLVDPVEIPSKLR